MSPTSKSKLYQPISLGDINLSHRIVLAPLTRFRASDDHVPHVPLVAEHYAQRASTPGTLVITEATYIDRRAGGVPNVPGIWSDEQISAWKQVTKAVHNQNSFIFLQIWGLGRAGHPENLAKHGLPYVSSSDVPLKGRPETDAKPRPLTVKEIKEYVDLFAKAADNAVNKAGFDGVEIHGANGYLLDQFHQTITNRRTDEYGGSPENRSRFTLEVVDAVVKAVGPSKVGLRISPWNTNGEMGMEDPASTFTTLTRLLGEKHPDLAYLHLVEPRVEQGVVLDDATIPSDRFELSNEIRAIWKGSSPSTQRPFLTAGGYIKKTAEEDADTKDGDIVVFGRLFLANPDLPKRLEEGLELNVPDRETFYVYGGKERKGYVDYPFVEEGREERVKASL